MGDRETVRDFEGRGRPPAHRLDLRGLRCPLPVLKIRKALACLAPGEELAAEVDDPLAGVDVPNLVRETGDELVETQGQGRTTVFRIRRMADSTA